MPIQDKGMAASEGVSEVKKVPVIPTKEPVSKVIPSLCKGGLGRVDRTITRKTPPYKGGEHFGNSLFRRDDMAHYYQRLEV